MMGMKVKPSALREIIEEIDEDGKKCNSVYTAIDIRYMTCQFRGSVKNIVLFMT